MSFAVVLSERVMRDIRAWKLPDEILVDVFIRLREQLSREPHFLLSRTHELFDGLTFPMEVIDPHNRLGVYRMFFHVVYGQDEETLHVLRAAMVYSFGM